MLKRYRLFIWGLLIAALIPYFYAACFIVPLADDYSMCSLAIGSQNIITAISHMYLKWNGRYASDLIILANPYIRWGRVGYELASVSMIAVGLLVNYILMRRLIPGEANRWMAALTVQLLFLFQLPDLSEGIYWYTGYITYYPPVLIFSLILLLVYDIVSDQWSGMAYLRAMLVLVLTFILAGFNEPIAVILVLFFFAQTVFVFERYPKVRIFSLLCLTVAVCGILLVVLAPGNKIREGYYHFDRNIPKIILMTHIQMLRFAADWISNLPFIFLSAVVVIKSSEISVKGINTIKLWWIMAAMYTVMLLCIILPYWGTGVLGQQRTLNMAYYFFIALSFLALIKISRSQFILGLLPLMSSDVIPTAMIITSIVCMALTKNGYKLDYDIVYGILPKYKAEQIARENTLKERIRDKTFSLPSVQNKPLSITLYNGDDFPWIEQCERGYLFQVEKRAAHQ